MPQPLLAERVDHFIAELESDREFVLDREGRDLLAVDLRELTALLAEGASLLASLFPRGLQS